MRRWRFLSNPIPLTRQHFWSCQGVLERQPESRRHCAATLRKTKIAPGITRTSHRNVRICLNTRPTTMDLMTTIWNSDGAQQTRALNGELGETKQIGRAKCPPHCTPHFRKTCKRPVTKPHWPTIPDPPSGVGSPTLGTRSVGMATEKQPARTQKPKFPYPAKPFPKTKRMQQE